MTEKENTRKLQNIAFSLKHSSFNNAAMEKIRETLTELMKIVNTTVHNKGNLMLTDCLASLVELVTKTEYPCDIREQATGLLNTLVQDDENKSLMEEEFSLTRSLLLALKTKPGEVLQIQILKLIQVMTYGSNLTWLKNEEKYGLRFVNVIIDILIDRPESSTFEVSLGILVNFCRNPAIQAYAANFENFSRLKSLLLQSLNSDNLCIILYCMSIIFHLGSMSEKVFSTRNIHQTLEVIINSLVNKTSGWTPFYAADLLMDLAKTSQTRNLLENYEYLSTCVTKVLLSLSNQADRKLQLKFLQLLLSFCEVSGRLHRTVSDLVFSHELLQSDAQFERLMEEMDAGRSECPMFALCHLIVHENSAESETAAKLIRELYDDLLLSGQTMNPRLSLVNRTLSATPVSCPAGSGREGRRLLRKWIHLLDLMTVLLDREEWFSIVSLPEHVDRVEQLVRGQLSAIPTSMRRPREEEVSADGACLVLRALRFMYATVERHPNENRYEASLTSFLPDSRVTSVLAFGIVGEKAENVQMALELTSAALLIDEFSINALGEHVHGFTRDLYRSLAHDGAPSLRAAAPMASGVLQCVGDENRVPNRLNDAVERLVSSMQSGMQISDAKTSDLLSVYEHKLQTLQTKESHLEDLLSTKTMALGQADALIVKYRSRLALSESENQKLRQLLLDYERQREQSHESIKKLEKSFHEMKNERNNLSSELKKTSGKLMETNDSLRKSQSQCKRLQENLTETSATLKKSTEKVKRLQEECTEKTKAIAELDKNIDGYRNRLDEAEQTIKEKTKQLMKYSEVTRLINSLTVDPASGDTVAMHSSGNSSGNA